MSVLSGYKKKKPINSNLRHAAAGGNEESAGLG